MVKKIFGFLVVAASAVLAACGGSGNTITSPPGGGGSGTVASIEVVASSPTLNSDAAGNTKLTITAVVKDSGNAIVAAVPVTFTTTSGSLTVTKPTTDSLGTAVAELTNGLDPSNRAITVTARAGTISGTVTVNVVGTTLTVTGPTALALTDSGVYTALLRDASGVGIPGRVVAASSATGNTLSSVNLITATNGEATVTVTATTGGNDTLTVQALSLSATQGIAVSSDVFTITTPTTNAEVALSPVTANVTVQWTKGGVPQNGETITFSSTRGTLSSSTATTAGGLATVTISSNNAGFATITATNDENTSTSVTIEFIAGTAANIELQASPLNVGIGNQSAVTALVRDSSNNLVKNKLVTFQLSDTTGGSLSIGSDLTDSQGRAQTVYTAGSVPSSPNGVVITAQVAGPPLVQDTVGLTVVGRAVDMSIGTGETLNAPTQSLYSKEWAIIVTDTSGTAPVPVANATLQASIRSLGYRKGFLALADDGSGDLDWAPSYVTSLGPPEVTTSGSFGCADEDADRDGFLSPAEDLDGDGRLEAGNRATLAGLAPGAPANACGSLTGGSATTNVQTDANGIARVCVIYPKSDNLWVDVQIKALLSVFGSEFTETQDFRLEALADDLDDEDSSPAGQISPFGRFGACNSPL